MKRFILILFLLLLLVIGYFARARLFGAVLEGYLEGVLTRLFNMEVTFDGLRVKPVRGEVLATGVKFMNQPEFANRPHLYVRGMQFDIDFKALLSKKVLIGTVQMYEPDYFIEQIDAREGPRTNVTTWVRYIKSNLKKRPEGQKNPWQVRIDQISLFNGTFVVDAHADRSKARRFVFESLNGSLSNFSWPAASPTDLTQKVDLRGTIGENYPAPFWIHGSANFATGQVSFSLDGEIPRGNVLEYQYFMENLPVEVKEGAFSLNSRTICVRKKLASENEIVIFNPKVSSGASVGDKLWGMPVLGAIRFIETQDKIQLNVPVHGDISDPKFEFPYAFRAAFNESLSGKVKSGLSVLKDRTVGLVSQTSEKMTDGIGQLAQKTATPVKAVAGEVAKTAESVMTKTNGTVSADMPPAVTEPEVTAETGAGGPAAGEPAPSGTEEIEAAAPEPETVSV